MKKISNLSCDQIYEIWRTEPELIELLDLRPHTDYSLFHIPGAINIPYSNDFFSNYQFSEQKLTVLLCPGFEEEVKSDFLKAQTLHVEISFMNKCHEWIKNGKPTTGKSIDKIKEEFSVKFSKNSDDFIFIKIHNHTVNRNTFIIGDHISKEAVVIDPVRENFEQINQIILNNSLKLLYCLLLNDFAQNQTEIFSEFKNSNIKIASGHDNNKSFADINLEDGQELLIGNDSIYVIIENKNKSVSEVSLYYKGRVITSNKKTFDEIRDKLPSGTMFFYTNE